MVVAMKIIEHRIDLGTLSAHKIKQRTLSDCSLVGLIALAFGSLVSKLNVGAVADR